MADTSSDTNLLENQPVLVPRLYEFSWLFGWAQMMNAAATVKNPNAELLIQKLIEDAREVESERRKYERIPYFRPAMIRVSSDDDFFRGFTRDISTCGIGLLHNRPVSPQPALIVLSLKCGSIVEAQVDIRWCVACGDGWYISAGKIRHISLAEGLQRSGKENV